MSKEAFNVDGFGKKIVESFWKLKLIKFPQDIFKLDYSKIELIEKDYGFSIFRYNSELNAFTAGGSEKFVISKHSIIALILIIQLEEKNKSLKFDTTYCINQKTFSVADYLGNKNNLLKFLFPQEPIWTIGEKGKINVKS